jgi:DNA-binding winged helix-turn-helix (wHTH) protein
MQYVFHDYVLDMARRELRGAAGPLSLEPKAYQVLGYLVQHRDRVVTREELLEQVWPGVCVDDSAVARCIRIIRQAVSVTFQIKWRGFGSWPLCVEHTAPQTVGLVSLTG